MKKYCLLVLATAALVIGGWWQLSFGQPNAPSKNLGPSPQPAGASGVSTTNTKELEAASKDVHSVQKAMEERFAEVKIAWNELEKHLKAFQPSDPASVKMTIQASRKVIEKNIEIGKAIEKCKPSFDQAFVRFHAAREDTPPAYRKLAESYEIRAKEMAREKGETGDFFSKQYFEWAKICREAASTAEGQTKDWERMYEKATEKFRFISRSTVFWTDVAKFLPIYERAVGNEAEVQTYLNMLDRHVENIKLHLQGLEDFANKIRVTPSAPPMKIS